VSAAVTDSVFNRVGLVLGSRLSRSQVEAAVHDVVSSWQFATFWSTANRAAHAEIVALLRGKDQSGQLARHNDQVVIDLSPVVGAVRNRLQETGVNLSSVPPDPQRTTVFVVVLPVIGLIAWVAAVLVHRGRSAGVTPAITQRGVRPTFQGSVSNR
jgi:hypothetical protein